MFGLVSAKIIQNVRYVKHPYKKKKQKAVISFSGFEYALVKENLIEAQGLEQENNDENNDVPNTEKVMTGNKDMQNDRAGLVDREDDESDSEQEHMESKSSKSERLDLPMEEDLKPPAKENNEQMEEDLKPAAEEHTKLDENLSPEERIRKQALSQNDKGEESKEQKKR